ncbi:MULTISPECIES: SusD/RagB family nutrient-binding outer membrane lipoprotein [Parabacteroides]|uniref:SusD/RagB family nutrient-binding outer membrane lipoprotein n=1 Tax=Parabacteroides leei TaxID=2939491 RepID=UPI001896E9C0|nr:SusD/RagB family nutrient-binding outer membrane lipoprotein [Parabacteroides goldsteinii]
MKNVKILAACSLLLLGVSSCDLTGLNENPNKPSNDVDYNMNEPRLLGTVRGGKIIDGDVEQRLKALQVDLYSQMVVDGGGWSTANYVQNDGWNLVIWEQYLKQLASLNIVIRDLSAREDAEDYANTIAFARIWRVYVHSMASDLFGPMPFPKPSDDPEANPPYREMEDIYTEYFSELDEAPKMFTSGAKSIFTDKSNDIVYQCDNDAWKRFANSLRLRLALRVSEVAPDVCKTQAQAAINADGGLISNSKQNAYMPPKADGSWGQDYNYVMFQITWGGPLNMSKSFEKLVTNIGGVAWPAGVENTTPTLTGEAPIPVSSVHPAKVDPRAPKIFQPSITGGNWQGLPYGARSEEQNKGDYVVKNYAELGYLVKDGGKYNSRPYDVFLYEEVCFLKAELFARGILAGDAKHEYEEGVRSSFEKWGVGSQADEYLASTEKNLAGTSAKYDDQAGAGNTALEKIITQKYIAGTPDLSWEGWSDKRRLNLPRLDVAIYRDETVFGGYSKDIKDPKNFIKRIKYPVKESLVNKDEYNRGVQMLGGKDNVAANLWWDKNANYCTSVE